MGGGTPHILCWGGDAEQNWKKKQTELAGWSGRSVGWFLQKIIPLYGSILQAGTCRIFSLAKMEPSVATRINISKRKIDILKIAHILFRVYYI